MSTAMIQERGTVSGNQPRMQRLDEAAAQTFLAGTPLSLTGGFVTAWNGTTVAAGIAGIAKDFGQNLATSGVPLGTVVAPSKAPFHGGGIKFGTVPNQPNAANLSRPYFNDGKCGLVLAIADTLFYGQVGPAQVTAAADVGASFGMTKDTDGNWYVDKTKNTPAAAVVQIVALDPWDNPQPTGLSAGGAGGRGVLFTFLPAAAQILA